MTDTDGVPHRPGREWVDAFAARCGVAAPDDATVDALLDMAGVAAHASERIAAPIACWILGQTPLTPAEGLALAKEI